MQTTLFAFFLTLAPSLLAGDDHDHHAAHEHHVDEHQHQERQAGPNGGRIIHAVKPHFEIWVREDHKLQITFLNDENQAIAPQAQEITAITGMRSNPTRMVFEPKDNVLLSREPLPEGKNLPIILNIKTTLDSKILRERFMLNTSQCPSCDYKEYACVCGH